MCSLVPVQNNNNLSNFNYDNINALVKPSLFNLLQNYRGSVGDVKAEPISAVFS
jgi:hypothetical protein